MRTFWISTYGCKVNQYESEQIAAMLRSRGLVEAFGPEQADLRIVNSCSVTVQAASKSRQAVRRMARLRVMACRVGVLAHHSGSDAETTPLRGHLLVTGCWATSDADEVAALEGVDAVCHHNRLASEFDRLLSLWQGPMSTGAGTTKHTHTRAMVEGGYEGLINQAETPTTALQNSKSHDGRPVKRKTRGLLKIQDGCDANCTYCIIPRIRPELWSKPLDDILVEARRLVDEGHREIVLTGIFLGAYGHPTAQRRRHLAGQSPLATVVEALCTKVPGLQRLRLSSIEPGDLGDALLATLRSHPQVVPHFHAPLQSGSDVILRRMNRQYRRDDYLRMVDRLRGAFGCVALTTDVIVGFPGETDEEFARTLDVVEYAGFIHVHAFSFSPRPGTPAARWTRDFVRGPVVNERIEELRHRAAQHSLEFRRQFLGETVGVLVESRSTGVPPVAGNSQAGRLCYESVQQGRSVWYFPVRFAGGDELVRRIVDVRVDSVTAEATRGTLVGGEL